MSMLQNKAKHFRYKETEEAWQFSAEHNSELILHKVVAFL